MAQRPAIPLGKYPNFEPLVVVRTSSSDDAAWLRIVDGLRSRHADALTIDDPAYDGPSKVAAQTTATSGEDETPEIAIVVDRNAKKSRPPLPPAWTPTGDDSGSADNCAEFISHGREFRADLPAAVLVHLNLEAANTDFFEFTAMAAGSSDGALHGEGLV